MAKRIDVETLPVISGTLYPPPFDEPCRARQRTRLGDAAGLTQYGVNLVRLKPGAWSSQRHWHIAQDEFIYVLSGEVTLVRMGMRRLTSPMLVTREMMTCDARTRRVSPELATLSSTSTSGKRWMSASLAISM